MASPRPLQFPISQVPARQCSGVFGIRARGARSIEGEQISQGGWPEESGGQRWHGAGEDFVGAGRRLSTCPTAPPTIGADSRAGAEPPDRRLSGAKQGALSSSIIARSSSSAPLSRGSRDGKPVGCPKKRSRRESAPVVYKIIGSRYFAEVRCCIQMMSWLLAWVTLLTFPFTTFVRPSFHL
ncbi:MAG: hypothetical protein JWR69_681 [Pedosphaera sp.]|nr:hypothetical protein [Pedosphaera sp.]